MLAAIAVNTVGIGLCLWAYSRPWQWERGPLMLLHGASILLGIASLCTITALLLETPEASGVIIAIACMALVVTLWRKRGTLRRGPLTSEITAADVSEVPLRRTRAQPIRNTSGSWSSVTIRDIENMEVQP